MSMKKIQDILLETTAKYQEKSKLNVRFWSQDRNTAELRFLITRNDYPLSLSSENVKVFLTLKSGDSFISTDDVNVYNEVEGVATYIIPEDFMRVANEVVGQVYVATLDEEEIVVQRKFSFTVENDLLSSIPSEEKIRYIKMFSDLQEEMSTRLGGVETALNQLESNVEEVDNAKQDGITALNNLYDAKLVTFNQNFDDKMALINSAMDNMENYVDTSLADMTAKKKAFDSSVSGSGLVTTNDSENWQKYKLTTDDGSYKSIDIKNDLSAYQNLKPGFYYTPNVPITGMGQTSTAGWTFVERRENYSNLKRITFRPYNSNQQFVMRYYNEWGNWENALANVETTQGSQAKATTAENNAKVYANDLVDKKTVTLFEGTANGVGTTINLSETLDNFIVLHFYGTFPGGLFNDLGNPYGTARINLTPINLLDTDGNGGGIYEIGISKTTRTQLTISNDVYFDLGTQRGSGANANKCTITRVVGVRK